MAEEGSNLAAHLLVQPSIRAVAKPYACVECLSSQDLLEEKCSITGDSVNRFSHMDQNTETRMNMVKMLRA